MQPTDIQSNSQAATKEKIAARVAKNNIKLQTVVTIFETELLFKAEQGRLITHTVEEITLAADGQSMVVYFRSKQVALNHQQYYNRELAVAGLDDTPKLKFRFDLTEKSYKPKYRHDVQQARVFTGDLQQAAVFLLAYDSISKKTFDLVCAAQKSKSVSVLLAQYSMVHSIAKPVSYGNQSGADNKVMQAPKKLSFV